MNQVQLLKKLLPGFIPLFIFILADEIWGTRVGLIVAIASGTLEFIYVLLKEKRFDKFILFDTLLIVALGMVSLILENDLFFKLKPALIEIVLITILGISAFSSFNLMEIMGKRYLKDMEMNKDQLILMRKTLRLLFFVFLVHTALVLYAAFRMSDAAWAFISGGLFYIIFGVFFVLQLGNQWYQKKRIVKEEWLPLVDMDGKITGKAPRTIIHDGRKLLHPVVHLHVIFPGGMILLQKRPLSKEIQPGKWDTAVGGHIAFGEQLEDALKREIAEEIGVDNIMPHFIRVYHWETEMEAELVYLFVSVCQTINGFKSSEADELKFWKRRDIEGNLDKEVFTASFVNEYRLLKEMKLI